MSRLIRSTLVLLTLTAPAVGAQQPAPLAGCSSPASGAGGVTRTSVYAPMADGTRLAVDVYLPAGLSSGAKLPTVLVSTRYWRAAKGQPIGPMETFFTSHGYAYVYADVRGTGASFGNWFYPWSPQEVDDLGGLVDWIVKQPWSDGKVGAIGTSYTGNTAQLVGATGRPAVKAVVPRFIDFDAYADLTFPGGVVNEFLISEWGKMVHLMDMNQVPGAPGVRPVDADTDGSLLAAAVRDHQANPPLNESLAATVFRDEKIAGFGGASNDMAGTYRYADQIQKAAVPLFGWASWLDAGTSQGAVNRFMNWDVPQLVVIGPWSHGGGNHADPFLPAATPTEPPSPVQNEQAACFFDQYVKGQSKGLGEKAIIYYTLGQGTWKKTDTWPIPGTRMQRWYLGEAHTLTETAPNASTGADRYQVDFEVSTGSSNRWYTQLGGKDVVYEERSGIDQRLLSYTSQPLASDVVVTGHGMVSLHAASTATDGNVIVYLEDVAPDGKVTYVTEALLRALHRKLSSAAPPYRTVYPYRSFLTKDAQPLVPGQVATLAFPFLPTSVLFKQGHRIRISIAGADQGTFARLPAQGEAAITVSRNRAEPSYIELPVVPR